MPRAERGGTHNDLIRWFEDEWLRSRPRAGAFPIRQKDAIAAARIMKLPGVTLDEAKHRCTVMLEHQAEWVIENASLPELLRAWHRYYVKESAASLVSKMPDRPDDFQSVETWWYAKHRTLVDVEVLGTKYKLPGADREYPGYEAAKREYLATRQNTPPESGG